MGKCPNKSKGECEYYHHGKCYKYIIHDEPVTPDMLTYKCD